MRRRRVQLRNRQLRNDRLPRNTPPPGRRRRHQPVRELARVRRRRGPPSRNRAPGPVRPASRPRSSESDEASAGTPSPDDSDGRRSARSPAPRSRRDPSAYLLKLAWRGSVAPRPYPHLDRLDARRPRPVGRGGPKLVKSRPQAPCQSRPGRPRPRQRLPDPPTHRHARRGRPRRRAARRRRPPPPKRPSSDRPRPRR
jgi:hypothetical protein